MDREQLLSLAERVEASAGPDREIDREVWIAADPNSYAIWEGSARGLLNRSWDEERRQVTLKARARAVAKPYTASLDAAMTLVPEGWAGSATRFKDGTGDAAVWKHTGFATGPRLACDAATPALALTAACLRALAHVKEEG